MADHSSQAGGDPPSPLQPNGQSPGVQDPSRAHAYLLGTREWVIPAWMLSLALHSLLLILLTLTIRRIPQGAAVEPTRTTGIVLAHRTPQRVEYYDGESDVESETDHTSEQEMTELFVPTAESLQTNLPHELPSSINPPVPATDRLGHLADPLNMTAGRPPPKRFGGSIQTSVFGLTGTGTKFVYLFDRSGSMGDFRGRPLHAAKTELLRSLDELEEIHQFQIIFYNQSPSVFNPTGESPRMWWGDERGKTLAKRFIQAINAVGNTEHMAALEMALRLQPDVIFFLTDADDPMLSAPQLERLRRLNAGSTVINAIEFGVVPDAGHDNFLRRLARQHAGRHVYINVSRLGGGAR